MLKITGRAMLDFMFLLYTISFSFFIPSFFLSFSCFDIYLYFSGTEKICPDFRDWKDHWNVKIVLDIGVKWLEMEHVWQPFKNKSCLCPQILKLLQAGSLIRKGWEEDTYSEGIISGWVPIKGRASSSSTPWYTHDLSVHLLDGLQSVSQQHLRCCPSYLEA